MRVLKTESLGVAWQLPIFPCTPIEAGAEYVAAVLELEMSEPELPFTRAQFTGRFAVKVTTPFSPAEVADGVITRPPLVIATAPVPVTPASTGEPASLPLITMDADSAATTEGLKETVIVQVAPEGTVLPQVFESRKSDAFGPLIVIPDKDKKDVPVFCTLIV